MHGPVVHLEVALPLLEAPQDLLLEVALDVGVAATVVAEEVRQVVEEGPPEGRAGSILAGGEEVMGELRELVFVEHRQVSEAEGEVVVVGEEESLLRVPVEL